MATKPGGGAKGLIGRATKKITFFAASLTPFTWKCLQTFTKYIGEFIRISKYKILNYIFYVLKYIWFTLDYSFFDVTSLRKLTTWRKIQCD